MEVRDFIPTNGNISDCDTDYYYKSKLSPGQDIAVATILLLLAFLSFIGNGLSITLFYSRRKNLSHTEFLIFTMCFMNLTISSGNLFSAASALHHEWIFGDLGCTLLGFLLTYGIFGHLMTIVFIADMRYLQVCGPEGTVIPKPRLYKAIISIFGIPFLLLCFQLTIMEGFTVEPFKFSCTIPYPAKSLESRILIAVVSSLSLLLPGLSCSYFYATILYKVYTTRTNLGGLSRLPHTKITKITLAMALVFGLSWIPYGATIFIASCTGTVPVSMEMCVIIYIMAASSAATSPLVYVFSNEGYKEEIKRMLVSRFNTGHSPST